LGVEKRTQESFDFRLWHNISSPEEMDVSRHFEYDEDSLHLLKKWLRLDGKNVRKIVEVGCGSGYFTGKLLELASSLEEFVGVEPDDVLRRHAESKLSPRVRFLKGSAEKLPLPDETSDLTVCHIVLCNLPNAKDAVLQMVRITKKGGIVAAIEPSKGGITYYPNERLTHLESQAHQEFAKVIWDMRRKQMRYPEDWTPKMDRYAEIFHSCGLEDVEQHGICSVFLLSDPRRKQDELLVWLGQRLSIWRKGWRRFRMILQKGGFGESLLREYYDTRKTYLENLIENPELILKTHELQISHRLVTIGFRAPESESEQHARHRYCGGIL